LIGTHGFAVISRDLHTSVLRHTLEARTIGAMGFAWPLVWRSLHDALIEDALDTAEASLARAPVRGRRMSSRVRVLRALARRLTPPKQPEGGLVYASHP
jgi:hypothetical protein